jgi:MFS family permease
MAKPPPHGLSWRSNTFFIVATVGIGLFTDLFLYGLVVPILPSILRDKVGEPPENIQKDVSALLTVYAAASVITSPFAGILADRLSSRQVPFLAGLVALLSATVLLFVGTTLPVLAVARILQGVSAAFVWTVGLALCLETVGAENLGKTIGSVSNSFQKALRRLVKVTNQTNVDLLLRLRGQPMRPASRRHSVRKDR